MVADELAGLPILTDSSHSSIALIRGELGKWEEVSSLSTNSQVQWTIN